LRIEGESKGDDNEELEIGGADAVYDGAGNKVDVKKTLNQKEAKKAIKEIEKKLKDAKDPKKAKDNKMTDEEMWELMDKLQELKDQLAKES